MCRSQRELFNEYLLAKIGVDTAENEPLEVWGGNSIQYSIVSLFPLMPPEMEGGRGNVTLILVARVLLPELSLAGEMA